MNMLAQQIEVDDVVMFFGDLFEVEAVSEDDVTLSGHDRSSFITETIFVKLVCKKETRLDLK